ncbi:MAG: DUF4364 family protein, partial [Candidatus Bathyarchaeota archaeon]|nr:DUF4364 family protein [Candidatus Bathyarchaeota archaeon]
QEILTSLTEKNLIAEIANGNKRTYEITEKGRNLLRYLKGVLDVLGSGKAEVDFEVEGSPKSSVSTQQS